MAQGTILRLLRHVQVHRVIIGRELVSLEELDGGLVELQYDDLMQEVQTFNVAFSRTDAIR